MNEEQSLYRKKHIFSSVVIAIALIILPWLVEIIEYTGEWNFHRFGLQPRSLQGLIGIITIPFLHGDFDHLISNSVPLFILISALFYFYSTVAWRIIFWILLIGGVWLWVIGASGSTHIGASGVVYGLAAYHFTAGVIRKNRNLTAFSLLVIFLYGSMIWAVFPDFYPELNISWEGHLTGMIAGVIMAFYYRKEGPQADSHWRDIDDDDEDDEYPGWDELNDDEDEKPQVQYHWKAK